MTPEGKIKERIKALLRSFSGNVYYFMPVQFGMGAAGLDFHCMARVRTFAVAFFIEAKAPGKPLSPRQEALVELFRGLNARVFVVDDDRSLSELRRYLARLQLIDQESRDERPDHNQARRGV